MSTENNTYDKELYLKLKEAELELKSGAKLKTIDEVFDRLFEKYS